MQARSIYPVSFTGCALALALALALFGAFFSSPARAHNHEPLDLDGLLKAFGWDFNSAEIKVEKITDDFYVLFGIGGNIGVSIGENGTMIVDDQFPQMMPKIEAALEAILRSTPTGTLIMLKAT